MANQTMLRFGYPDTLVREYEHWVVLLRPEQVTLGSLVLCATSEATTFSGLPAAAYAALGVVTGEIEQSLAALFRYDRINYIMLMMVDPNVHFHVLPRYETERSACGLTLRDGGWPRLPLLGEALALDAAQRERLRDHIRAGWRSK